MRRARGLLLVAVALLAAACGPQVPAAWVAEPDPWETWEGRTHPLTGRIWDVAERRFIDRAELAARVARAPFVLLGERHDNDDHHRLQAWVLRAMIAAGRRPAVAFEMFETTAAPAIARQLARAPRDAQALADAVDWASSGWPPWKTYAPIAQLALDANLPIVAANLPLPQARSLVKQGVSGIDAVETVRLGLDRPLPAAAQSAMIEEMSRAHCGEAPPALLEGMVLAQRARDAQMALSLAEAADPDGAVLIAGAGHVRRDRGVPAYLSARAPGLRIVTIAFLEVTQGQDQPADYARSFGTDVLPFDYAWFTPRYDDVDRCRAARAR